MGFKWSAVQIRAPRLIFDQRSLGWHLKCPLCSQVLCGTRSPRLEVTQEEVLSAAGMKHFKSACQERAPPPTASSRSTTIAPLCPLRSPLPGLLYGPVAPEHKIYLSRLRRRNRTCRTATAGGSVRACRPRIQTALGPSVGTLVSATTKVAEANTGCRAAFRSQAAANGRAMPS